MIHCTRCVQIARGFYQTVQLHLLPTVQDKCVRETSYSSTVGLHSRAICVSVCASGLRETRARVQILIPLSERGQKNPLITTKT